MNAEARRPPPYEPVPEPNDRPTAGHVEQDGHTGATPGTYAATLRRHWRLVALAVILAGVSGFLLSTARPHTYEAKAKVLLGQQGSVDALLGAGSRSPDQERDINTSVQLVGLDSIADRVRRRTGLRISTAALLRRVTATVQGNTDILDITARDADPRIAAAIANGFAIAYRDFRTQSARAAVDDALKEAERRLRRLGAGAAQTRFGRRLAAEVNRLQILASFQTGGVQFVRPATPPGSPSGMGSLKAAAIAAALGMLLAGGLVVLVARTDPRLHNEGDVERVMGLPVLAKMPWRPDRHRAGRRASSACIDDGTHEAYGALAARLAYSRIGMSPRVLLLASADDGTATSAMALDLARALRTIGRTVVAVEADLRAPRWADELNLQPAHGLARLLMLGEGTIESAMFDLPGAGAEVSAKRSSVPSDGRAWVVPAGLPAPQPQKLLSGNTMARLVDDAWGRADFVLLAAPPLARECEVLTLAAYCDGALIIVRQGTTTEEEARRAQRNLDDVDVTVIGAVLAYRPARWAAPGSRRSATSAVQHRNGGAPQVDRAEDGADPSLGTRESARC